MKQLYYCSVEVDLGAMTMDSPNGNIYILFCQYRLWSLFQMDNYTLTSYSTLGIPICLPPVFSHRMTPNSPVGWLFLVVLVQWPKSRSPHFYDSRFPCFLFSGFPSFISASITDVEHGELLHHIAGSWQTWRWVMKQLLSYWNVKSTS